MTRRWLLFLLFYTFCTGAGAVAQKSDLEGAWTAFAAERDGAAAGELVGNRIEFSGDRFSITKAGSAIYAGHVAVAPEAATIDFTVEEGEAKGQSWQGIFRIENATLTICDNAPDRTARRPSTFTAPKGSGHVCLQFRR